MRHPRSSPSMVRLRLTPFEPRITPATYSVTNLANAGAGSLRQAIADANANAGADTVVFDPGVFAAPQTILLAGTLSITGELTITGPAAGATLKNTLANTRVIDVYVAPTGTKVNFSNLTITGGGATSGLTAGVYGTGQVVTLTNCVLTGNTAANGVGAVSVFGGSLTVLGCTIANNQGTVGGGITVNAGSLLVENSAITGNVSTQNAGGGVRFYGTPGPGGLTVRNCTIANNTAANAGGGIGFFNLLGPATVQNCTISGNVLTSVAAGGGGGGVGRLYGSGTINLTSCIVSGNTASLGPDVASTGTVNVNYCAIGESAGFKLTGANNLAFQPVVNLKLGSLSNNGGPTNTIALLAGSPCINAGSNPAMLVTDQRGPGYVRDNGGVDIGAFEVQGVPPPPPTVTSAQINDGAAQRSMVTSIKVSLSEAVTFPAGLAAAFTLTRTGPGTPTGNVNLAFTQSGGDVTITFFDPVFAPAPLSLIDGNYTLTIVASKVQGTGGNLDGNGDGTAGDDRVQTLHRLFGDADGDRDVDTSDFAVFRAAFGGSNTIFDFDGDGDVDTSDFGAFRSRFGASV